MVRKRSTKASVTAGSGNVFADLGLTDPEEALTKAHLLMHIQQVIKRRRLTQASASELMGIDRATVAALMADWVDTFSSERLMQLLTRLGQDVEVTIRSRPSGRKRGRIRVVREMYT